MVIVEWTRKEARQKDSKHHTMLLELLCTSQPNHSLYHGHVAHGLPGFWELVGNLSFYAMSPKSKMYREPQPLILDNAKQPPTSAAKYTPSNSRTLKRIVSTLLTLVSLSGQGLVCECS